MADNKLIVFALADAFHLGVLSSQIHVTWALGQGAMLEDRPVYPKSECFDPFPFPLCGEAEKERIRKLAEELDAHRKRVQAQHGLTLTGLYNVLEKIRAGERGVHAASTSAEASSAELSNASSASTLKRPEGRASALTLTAKEKLIHDHGLVSVLKQLHDDLDDAVFAAYGWPATLTDAEILERLVALNAERAAEEKRGIIHWLRPEYQGHQKEIILTERKPEKKTKAAPAKRKTKTAWPKAMAERVQAVQAALHAAGAAVTPAELAAQFARAKPADVAEILKTLETLGRARHHGNKFTR